MRVNLTIVFSPFGINRNSECSKNKQFVYHECVYTIIGSSNHNLLTFIIDVTFIKIVKTAKFDIKKLITKYKEKYC